MVPMLKMPIGIEFFEEIREQGFYYIDKTMFIKDLLENRGKVNLFTRPRRFGKTLNMSMLKSFFEIGADSKLFDGLDISRDMKVCERYQGQYPVVFLSLKGVEGETYEDACMRIAILVANVCKQYEFLAFSEKISQADKILFNDLINQNTTTANLQYALVTLMRMLRAYYGKQVILLIDEYDVPLDKANENGYYNRMVTFIRGFLGEAFKTNADLFLAVVTGCLRISKESIFTGINNLKVDTISDERYDEYFGFTEKDVRKILADYGLSHAYEDTKQWYDGYHFGRTDVYCPWDVINYCDKLLVNPKARPQPYWINTSSNQMVRRFIDKADATTRQEIEQLIAGGSISKKLMETLTYEELDESIEHLWSVLYLTGYLTADRKGDESGNGVTKLVIPNLEIREIFIEKIQRWFADKVAGNRNALEPLYSAFHRGDAEKAEEFLGKQLRPVISYYDVNENFYHGFVLGLIKGQSDWIIRSNREAGEGRSDIQIGCEDGSCGMVLELKYVKSRDELAAAAEKAVQQAKEKGYAEPLLEDGYESIYIYGIAFHKKSCCVRIDKVK